MSTRVLPSAVSLEPFPADPDFPQLRIATDPRRMLALFRAHLRPVDGKALQIQDCVPFRFRCRQSGSRCVLQYTLVVVEPGTGRRWHLWVTGLLYVGEGEAERVWQELQDADPCRDMPDGWRTFEPVAFIPELQMVVEVFPYDRKLPNLRLMMGSALAELEPLLLPRLGRGQWRVEQRQIEPTRFRTELGAALRLTIHARNALMARTLRCYLKVYRNKQGAETVQLLRAIAERAGDGKGPYSVVLPIAYLSELRTLVLAEAPGGALHQMLLAGGDGVVVRAVARAVAALNQDALPVERVDSLEDQLEDVRWAGSLVQWACPDTRADVEAITAAVEEGLRPVPLAPIHRDLKPDHIFLSGGRVTFIDCDAVALGDPVRDPAHLYAHLIGGVGLDAMHPIERRAVATAFAAEYFAHVPASWRERFALHCAGALVEVAGGIFKRQELRWPEKVTAAVTAARQALNGGMR